MSSKPLFSNQSGRIGGGVRPRLWTVDRNGPPLPSFAQTRPRVLTACAACVLVLFVTTRTDIPDPGPTPRAQRRAEVLAELAEIGLSAAMILHHRLQAA